MSCTVTVELPPTGIVTGSAGLTIVNAAVEEVIPETVNGRLPVLLMTNVRVAF